MADTRAPLMWGLMGGLFLAAMDATVLAVAMPAIVEDLGGAHLYAWGFTTYMLAAAVSMPVLGALSDRHGRKRFFLGTLGLFVLGSVACGASPNMPFFLAARVLQGIGGGGMLSIPFAMAGALFHGKERGRALGRLSSVWGVASIAGPLLGALAVNVLSWEWVFYVNIPVGLAGGFLVATRHVEEPPARAPPVDLWGAALLMAGLSGLLLSLEDTVPARLAFALGGFVLLALFVWRERGAPAPLLPLRLLGRRAILTANVGAALAAGAIFVAIVYVPRFVEAAHGDGRSLAAVFPLSIAWSGTSTLVGRHLHTPTRVANAGMAGLALLGGALLLAPEAMAHGLAGIATASFVMGLAMGLLTPALLLRVQNASDVAQMGVVTSSQTFLRNVGGAVGIAALGALVHGATLADVAPALRLAGGVAFAGLVAVGAGLRA